MTTRRVAVLREGEPTEDGRLILAGAAKWATSQLPLTDTDGNVVGSLTDFERTPDGYILATADFSDDDLLGRNLAAFVDQVEVEDDYSDPIRLSTAMSSVRLRSVTVEAPDRPASSWGLTLSEFVR